MPPEEARVLEIILGYQDKRLSLAEAAPQLRDALNGLTGDFGLSMSPSARRLFAEAAKLDGQEFPEYQPDPDRHADGGRGMLERLTRSGWRRVSEHPRIDQPLSIGFHFTPATEETAKAIAKWLSENGQRHVEVKSPEEADSGDWVIRAATPSVVWFQDSFAEWVTVVRNAPLSGEASFMGWSV